MRIDAHTPAAYHAALSTRSLHALSSSFPADCTGSITD
jgi:hypothetical protein